MLHFNVKVTEVPFGTVNDWSKLNVSLVAVVISLPLTTLEPVLRSVPPFHSWHPVKSDIEESVMLTGKADNRTSSPEAVASRT